MQSGTFESSAISWPRSCFGIPKRFWLKIPSWSSSNCCWLQLFPKATLVYRECWGERKMRKPKDKKQNLLVMVSNVILPARASQGWKLWTCSCHCLYFACGCQSMASQKFYDRTVPAHYILIRPEGLRLPRHSQTTSLGHKLQVEV